MLNAVGEYDDVFCHGTFCDAENALASLYRCHLRLTGWVRVSLRLSTFADVRAPGSNELGSSKVQISLSWMMTLFVLPPTVKEDRTPELG